MKIILIGAGNVATHLGLTLKAAGHRLLQVYSRSESSANVLSKKLNCDYTIDKKNISGKADLYIIALSDAAIRPFLKDFTFTGKPVVHTSGSVSSSVFGKKFRHSGVLYPVQTFSIAHKVKLKNVPFCIEANTTSMQKVVKDVVVSIGGKILLLNSAQRKKVHLAAVFANNFTNHLFAIAEKLLSKDELPFDLLKPLILETATKIQHHSPLDVQTGPAKRGDTLIMEEHVRMLVSNKKYQEIYRLISESISEMSGIRL